MPDENNFSNVGTRPMYPMYVIDPETNTAALPVRPHKATALAKVYQRACCGSVFGILVWILALLLAIFVPVGILLARSQPHASNAEAPDTAAMVSTSGPVSLMIITVTASTSPATTTPSVSTTTVTTVSADTTVLTSVVTSISVSIVTYSPPPTVFITTAVTTTDTDTSISTLSAGATVSSTVLLPTVTVSPSATLSTGTTTSATLPDSFTTDNPNTATTFVTSVLSSSPLGATTVTAGKETTDFPPPVSESASTKPSTSSVFHTSKGKETKSTSTPPPGPTIEPREGPNTECSGGPTGDQCRQVCVQNDYCSLLIEKQLTSLRECCKYCDCQVFLGDGV